MRVGVSHARLAQRLPPVPKRPRSQRGVPGVLPAREGQLLGDKALDGACLDIVGHQVAAILGE